jgi:hypothetical protein
MEAPDAEALAESLGRGLGLAVIREAMGVSLSQVLG